MVLMQPKLVCCKKGNMLDSDTFSVCVEGGGVESLQVAYSMQSGAKGRARKEMREKC